MSKAKNKLILTHEGGSVWTYEVHNAKEQENLTTLQMLPFFRDEIDRIIEKMVEQTGVKPTFQRRHVAAILDRKLKCSKCDKEMITEYHHPFEESCPCSIFCPSCGYAIEVQQVWVKEG